MLLSSRMLCAIKKKKPKKFQNKTENLKGGMDQEKNLKLAYEQQNEILFSSSLH